MNSRRLDALFAMMLSLMMGHELDAVAQHEWRLLPGLSRLPDAVARPVFVALHVPLLAALAFALFVAREPTRRRTRLGFAAFMALHVVLHWTLEVPGVSSFDELSSRVFIHGAGLLGALALFAMRRAPASSLASE